MAKRRRRAKLRAPEGLDRVLARAGEDRFAPNRAPLPPHVWAAAVGARIAERTAPGRHRERGSSSFAPPRARGRASSRSSPTRSSRASARPAWSVRALRFRVGPIEPPERDAELRISKVPGPTPLDAQVARAIGRIQDDELREAIADAARKNLAWQTMTEPAVASGEPRAARAPRDAGTETDPPVRRTRGAHEAVRGNRGGD